RRRGPGPAGGGGGAGPAVGVQPRRPARALPSRAAQLPAARHHRGAGRDAADLVAEGRPRAGQVGIPRVCGAGVIWTDEMTRVAAGLAESSGVPFRVGDVFLTPGGSAALHVAFDVAFPLGGEVLVPVPCWIDYPLYLLRHGLSYRTVPLGRGKRLDVAALDRE